MPKRPQPVARSRKKTPIASGEPVFPYLYVEVRAFRNADDELIECDPVSFDSIQVDATSEMQAYQIGAAALERRQEDQSVFRHPHLGGTFLNDYAVRVVV